MITAEIKVNGALIGYVQAINVGESGKHDGCCIYNCAVHDMQRGKVEEIQVEHTRRVGWDVLFTTILSNVGMDLSYGKKTSE